MKTKFIRHLDHSSLEQTERIISHRGVVFHGLSYVSPLLNAVHQLNRAPDRTAIHFDRNDLSYVYLFEQVGPGFAAIPCSYFRYAKGLSLNEHRAVLSYCRRFSPNQSPNEDMLLQILWEIRSGSIASDSVGHFGCRSNCTRDSKPRNGRKAAYYDALMARLGSEVQNFGIGGKHV